MRAVVFQDLPVLRPSQLQWVSWEHPRAVGRHTWNFNSNNDSNYSSRGVSGRSRGRRRASRAPARIQFLAPDHAGDEQSGPHRRQRHARLVGVLLDARPAGGVRPAAGRVRRGSGRRAGGGDQLRRVAALVWRRAFGRRTRAHHQRRAVRHRRRDGVELSRHVHRRFLSADRRDVAAVGPADRGRELRRRPAARAGPDAHVDPSIVRLPPGSDAEGLRRNTDAVLAPMDAAIGGADAVGGQTVVEFSTGDAASIRSGGETSLRAACDDPDRGVGARTPDRVREPCRHHAGAGHRAAARDLGSARPRREPRCARAAVARGECDPRGRGRRGGVWPPIWSGPVSFACSRRASARSQFTSASIGR